MVNEKFKRTFDARIWKTGNGFVVTIPSSIIKRFELKEGKTLEVTIKQ